MRHICIFKSSYIWNTTSRFCVAVVHFLEMPGSETIPSMHQQSLTRTMT